MIDDVNAALDWLARKFSDGDHPVIETFRRLRAENARLQSELTAERDCLDSVRRDCATLYLEKERLTVENAKQAETIANLKQARDFEEKRGDDHLTAFNKAAETIARLREACSVALQLRVGRDRFIETIRNSEKETLAACAEADELRAYRDRWKRAAKKLFVDCIDLASLETMYRRERDELRVGMDRAEAAEARVRELEQECVAYRAQLEGRLR